MCRRATILGLLAALPFAGLAAPAPAAAAPGQEAVHALTKGCYGLRAVDSGHFVVKDGAGWRASPDATVVGAGEPFRMQATTLGQYMLYGRAGDFVATGGGLAEAEAQLALDTAQRQLGTLEAELNKLRALPPLGVVPDQIQETEEQVAEARRDLDAAREALEAARGDTAGGVEVAPDPGPAADWVVTATGGAMRLRAAGNGRALAVGDGGRLRTVEGEGSRFTFEKADGCATFPEAEINITGEPSKGEAPSSQVRGMLDAHIHMMAFEFLGGRAHCGRPWSPFGIEVALVDCPDHGARGETAILENAISQRDEPLTHDRSGWPQFAGWPTWGSLTHEQTYYRWLERAWRGGLRVYVNLLVENGQLCNLYPLKQNSCDEMDAVRLQAKRIRELEAYIDAQEGGPGKGWFRIVTDPFQARRVANQGKLAVVLGIEVSRPFNCQVYMDRPTCTKDDIERGLEEVHDLGVRDMELVNKFDNALSGVAGDNGTTGVVVNNGNKMETGKYWQMETCKGPPEESDREQPTQVPVEHNDDDLVGAGFKAFASTGVAPIYGPGPHCNQRGLTDLGAFMVERMMDKKMIIDPDHMSVKARQQLLPLLEKRGYSGIVSSHSWSTADALPRISRLGGLVAPYAGDSTSFVEAWKQVRASRDERFHFGVGYGADMNGFGKQGRPRGADAKDKVRYPFKGLDPNVTVHQNKTGSRTWDINSDGVAHYGLYPDWVEDLRKLAGDEIVEDLAQGAEAYLQMWERTEGIAPRGCLPARERLTSRGLEGVQVGRKPVEIMRAEGQPADRPGRTFRYCAKRSNGDTTGVTAVFTDAGTAGLVASRVHKASGVGPGDPQSSLGRLSGSTRVASDIVVRRLDGGTRHVWGVEDGRVRWTGVATAAVAQDARALRAAARSAGVVR
jgi:microsomal dipeptidase-like Zn-dependent dipeptidase